MCGIVGYIGKRKAYPILIKGLHRLEYRGYDSAGVALINPEGQLNIYKAKGKVSELEAFAADKDTKGCIGIAHTRWATHGEPNTINAHPHYSESHPYPVLYLLHGLNGNETAWNDRGRAAQTLDNLIAQNKAKPMILVMPDANPVCLISQKEEIGLFKNILLYPSWNKMEFETCYPEIDSFLSERYHFSTSPGQRAVAGLSAGAKQSANLANLYDSTFSSVGLFSPVVGKKQLPQNTYSKYWISGGTGDLFHHRINKFCKRMQRKHLPYTMYSSAGGHTWRNWRVYFSEYVQTLFWQD